MEDNSKEDNEINEILGEDFNDTDYKKLIITEDTIKTVDTYDSIDMNDRQDIEQLPIIFNNDSKAIEALELDERDGSDLDSASVIRADNSDQLKKKIYKQALTINQNSLVSPKLQRIHEGVSKVFGLDDPPPGFGLIYPKFYYLEQKRPQPMSPLKVWRGFNGNIYFEPIQLQSQAATDSKEPLTPTHQDPLPDIYENRPELKYANQIENRPNSLLSKDVTEKEHTIGNITEFDDQLTDLDDQRTEANKYFFSTYKDEFSHTDINGMTNSSISAFINARKNNYMKSSYPMSTYNESKLDFNPPNNDFILTTTTQQKKMSGSAEKDKQAILPNLNAVKRNNIPLKGLAFREAKSRINFSSINDNSTNDISQHFKTEASASLAYYTYQNSKTLPEEYFRNFNINTNTIINSSFIEDTKIGTHNPQNKKTYKEIFRGIRRGVTINLGNINQTDTKFFNEKLEMNRRSAKQRTRENLKNLKILNVKGDRITSFEILNNSEPYTSGKKISKSSKFEPNSLANSIKITNSKPAPYLSTSNLSFKSNMSAHSMGTGLRRVNPTPEIS